MASSLSLILQWPPAHLPYPRSRARLHLRPRTPFHSFYSCVSFSHFSTTFPSSFFSLRSSRPRRFSSCNIWKYRRTPKGSDSWQDVTQLHRLVTFSPAFATPSTATVTSTSHSTAPSHLAQVIFSSPKHASGTSFIITVLCFLHF